jgi:hypothetical protein
MMVEKTKDEQTPLADAKQDSEGAGTSLADVAAALRASGAFTQGGADFVADINTIEFMKLLTAINAASESSVKLANDAAQQARTINAAMTDNFTAMANQFGNMIGKFSVVDQMNLAQDRKWNVDEVSGYAVLNTNSVAEVVKEAIRSGFADILNAVTPAKKEAE